MKNWETIAIIVSNRMTYGIMEKVSDEPIEKHEFYLTHKPGCSNKISKDGFWCKCKTASFGIQY